MGCKINTFHSPKIPNNFSTKKPILSNTCSSIHSKLKPQKVTFSYIQNKQESHNSSTTTTQIQSPKSNVYNVKFKTLGGCKLGISRYPDFEYNAQGGSGTGFGTKVYNNDLNREEVSVCFDLEKLYIPPLTSATTRFLGLPLPPFLKIDIVPELFQGKIDHESGKVELEFQAKFWFSASSIYKAPPLMVETILTSEVSNGTMRSGRGERLDKDGRCRLVGVATVNPIDDFFMNTFLSLPTECLANMNAVISFSDSP
ncbi:hypothetical protein RJ641_008013 [Dillenia turbinata]|uniref:Uncharacterized protein n=1 Tax=Dillenia turbinata TaxID=194707 RepID=A0AAN8Z4K7_9MAGN